MIRLRLHGDPLLLSVAICVLACWTPGCQRVTDTRKGPVESSAADAAAKQARNERLPDEPDDLSQDLPAEVIELLSEHFPDYTLPLDEPPPESKPASKAVTQKQYFKISDKPLAEAICNNEIERARRLIEVGKHNSDVYRSLDMLHLAAQHGQAEICGQLLDAGLSVHRKSEPAHGPGRTPLQFAIRSGSVDTAMLLLARGAKLTPADSAKRNGSARTPLVSLAITSGNPDMLQFLMDQGEKPNDLVSLVNAIRTVHDPEKRRQFVKLLLPAVVELELQDGEWDPFVDAAATGDLRAVAAPGRQAARQVLRAAPEGCGQVE